MQGAHQANGLSDQKTTHIGNKMGFSKLGGRNAIQE
jgi:hypothetical protein